MSDDDPTEVVIKNDKRFAVGSEWWELRDSATSVDYVDLIPEARMFNGIVHLSLGCGIQDANNVGIVDVTNRLRFNLFTAQALHGMLGKMIEDAMKPVDKSQTN